MESKIGSLISFKMGGKAETETRSGAQIRLRKRIACKTGYSLKKMGDNTANGILFNNQN